MAWVATTPTPASAQRTPLPTENTRDCTAPPTSPVAGSQPRIENVATGSHGESALNGGTPANADSAATNNTASRRIHWPSSVLGFAMLFPQDVQDGGAVAQGGQAGHDSQDRQDIA